VSIFAPFLGKLKPPTLENMVGLNSVSKWYVNQRKILDTVCLDLKKGDFLYIIGGSGSGKTTLLKIITGEIESSLGSVCLFGIKLDSANDSTLAAIRRCIGVIPQHHELISELSVFDNVALSLTLAQRRFLKSEHKESILDTLKRLGLADKAYLPVQGLSGGEAQRVAVARALIRKPELIIADEPTGLATHDREIVRRVRKRSAILRQGSVTFEDPLCIY
jgi:ABC-type ATPase involved in cell division